MSDALDYAHTDESRRYHRDEMARIHERIDSHDRVLTRLETTVSGFVESSSAEMKRLAVAQEAMTEALNARGQTNWSMLAAWAGVILALGVAYTTAVTDRLTLGMKQQHNEIKIRDLLHAAERDALLWRLRCEQYDDAGRLEP